MLPLSQGSACGPSARRGTGEAGNEGGTEGGQGPGVRNRECDRCGGKDGEAVVVQVMMKVQVAVVGMLMVMLMVVVYAVVNDGDAWKNLWWW